MLMHEIGPASIADIAEDACSDYSQSYFGLHSDPMNAGGANAALVSIVSASAQPHRMRMADSEHIATEAFQTLIVSDLGHSPLLLTGHLAYTTSCSQATYLICWLKLSWSTVLLRERL